MQTPLLMNRARFTLERIKAELACLYPMTFYSNVVLTKLILRFQQQHQWQPRYSAIGLYDMEIYKIEREVKRPKVKHNHFAL
jgi:hypothetical protein